MDDTQKDGSDSDWDSTLDFTSPRQVGVGKPKIQYEVEDEESALSNESEFEVEENLPNDYQVIKNVLRPQAENQDRNAPVPPKNVKENNIALAQKKQNGDQQRPSQPANHSSQQGEEPPPPPPYNFREAVEESRTPEPPRKDPSGKDRKGNKYDPAPSPTPRGISKNQGSIRSVGSWDESDADERTLRELRANYKEQKQKEVQKQKEIDDQRSLAEDAPQTARSEATWRSWTGKFGKKSKSKNNQSQASEVSVKQQQRQQQQSQGVQQQQIHLQVPQQQQRQQQQQSRMHVRSVSSASLSQIQADTRSPVMEVYDPRPQQQQSWMHVRSVSSASLSQIQADTRSPVMEVYDPSYDRIVTQNPPVQYIQQQSTPVQYAGHQDTNKHTSMYIQAEDMEEPKRLIDRDEDNGRYLYFFGHGNLRYFEVNEEYDEAVLPPIADKVDRISRRIWQEVFSLFRILLSVFIWFIVELFQFLAKHFLQPLIVGIFVTLGDYVIKPFLSAIFNGFVQPTSIFMWNVFTGMRHMFGPIGEILRKVFEQVAFLFRAIRLFELTWVSNRPDGPRPYANVQNI